MKTVKSPENIHWTQGDDPKRFTDQLMEQLEINEAEVSRLLLNSLLQHASPEQALENLKQQFPHLPSPEFTVGDQAMQLVAEAEEAFESGKKRQAKTLLKKALTLDPNCADAYLLEADMLPENTPFPETYGLLQKALAAGKLAIGTQQDFDDGVGEFWSWAVTRPYMRALETLTRTCWMERDYTDEAIQHAFEMIRLNPNDNQGIRQCLLYWLMVKNRWDEAHQLWKQYEKKHDAWWIYGRSLLTAYREGAKSSTAKKHFDVALEYNPFVAVIFMMGESKFMYSLMQDYYKPGDPSEAAYMVNDLMLAQGSCMPEELATSKEDVPVLMRLFYEMVDQIGPKKFDKMVHKATQKLMGNQEES
jgi:tetratricopeptide (TPR) repeat protein